jgi:hypothetical protein
MRELSPRREPPGRWPALVLTGVGIVAAGGLLWAAVDPSSPPSERLPAGLAVAVAAAELAAVALGVWALSAAPRRLDYRLRGRGLVVTQLLSQRRVPLTSVASAEVLPYDLGVVPGAHLGWPRSYLPGYYVGWWRMAGVGRVRVAVAARSGTGVLLRFRDGPPLLLAPREPEALTSRVERFGGTAGR